MPVSNGTTQVNPSGGAILVQTGALAQGLNPTSTTLYVLKFTVWTTVAIDIQINRRNKANNANVWSVNYAVTARFFQDEITTEIGDGESIQIILVNSSTGSVQASIFYNQLYRLSMGVHSTA